VDDLPLICHIGGCTTFVEKGSNGRRCGRTFQVELGMERRGDGRRLPFIHVGRKAGGSCASRAELDWVYDGEV